MDFALLIKFLSAFAFVIATMFLLWRVLQRLGLSSGAPIRPEKRRLKIVEFLPLDHRRRLVLVRRDDCEHLLVLGPQGETVVETHIGAGGKSSHVEN